jgi:mannose-1-phosphate guanylyltransferase
VKQGSNCGPAARAAIVLAGGEGLRLRSLARRITGQDLPKQFCPVLGHESLLEQTLNRVALGIEPDLTFVAVTRDHERFYAPILAGLPAQNVVVQPRNRGTAPAILYSLLRLAETAPQARVAIFPCDHFVENDQEFMRHVEIALSTSALRPELTVLLGMTPEWPETAYGWIEPGTEICETPVFRVNHFWEKPVAEVAKALMHRGSLWNSFVMVGQLSTLLALFLIGLPELYLVFKKVRHAIETKTEQEVIERLYLDLNSTDFSEKALATRRPINLAVLPVRGIGWSDLGEPIRVMDTIARLRIRPQWARCVTENKIAEANFIKGRLTSDLS